MNSGIKRITIERSACNGPCPIYKASITGLGEVSYEGEHFVAREGSHTWKISTMKLEQLARAFEEASYFSLMREYQEPDISCNPCCITSIEYEDGRTKQVDHNLGDFSAPPQLTRLEDKIDKLAGINRYTRGRLSQKSNREKE